MHSLGTGAIGLTGGGDGGIASVGRAGAALVGCKDHPYRGVMITSRLTSKAQTTIPQPVRVALRLGPGDEIAYVIEAGRVVLTRAQPDRAADDPFRTFAEWDGPADTEAYAGL